MRMIPVGTVCYVVNMGVAADLEGLVVTITAHGTDGLHKFRPPVLAKGYPPCQWGQREHLLPISDPDASKGVPEVDHAA